MHINYDIINNKFCATFPVFVTGMTSASAVSSLVSQLEGYRTLLFDGYV